MNCSDIAAALDEHRTERLTAAEHGAADRHLMICEDCAAAWHAQAELLALRIPAVTPALPATIAAATGQRAAARPHRRLRSVAIGTALLAGAALATVTTMLARSPVSQSGHPARPDPAAQAAAAAAQAPPGEGAGSSEAPPQASTSPRTSPELVEIPLDLTPMTREPPLYPPAALEQGIEGRVQLRFDVSAAGVVENVRVIDSTNSLLDSAAVESVAKWRYLPRIAAGKRVSVADVATVISFALQPEAAPSRPAPLPDREATARAAASFRAGLDAALDRFAADDLRGAELQLDELQALYEGDGYLGQLKHFEGYLHTVQGRYDRAIEAYDAGIAAYVRAGTPWAGQWVPLATLYFARHQYDAALRTLLSYKEQIVATRARYPNRPPQPVPPEVEAFIERLAVLGVTEKTLAPHR